MKLDRPQRSRLFRSSRGSSGPEWWARACVLTAAILAGGCGLTRSAAEPLPEDSAWADERADLAEPALEPVEASVPSRKPEDLLTPCLPKPQASVLALETALDRALETRDTRCWTAVEIALGHRLLEEADELPQDARERQIRLAGYRFRQAELRASRYGFDELAALAHHGRARSAMRRADREGVLLHLANAIRAAGLHAASTGEAQETLDEIFIQRMVENLAAWEHRGDHALVAAALESASQLKAREALRAFREQGAGIELLARAVGGDAQVAVSGLLSWSDRVRKTYGRENRLDGSRRVLAAEVVLQNGSVWTAAAPLLLGWLPATMPEILTGLQTVLGSGELLLDYSVGEDHGVLLAFSENGFVARPLPGRVRLEELVAACRTGDCEAFDEALLGPAADLLIDARQVLVAAHGPLHQGPFEARIEARTVRVPSALGLTIIRLREWDAGPRAHPDAATLVAGAESPPLPASEEEPEEEPEEELEDAPEGGSTESGEPEAPASVPARLPVLDAPGDARALAPLWATLAAGSHLIDWRVDGRDEEIRRYGAPLTVPAPPPQDDPEPEEEPSGAEGTQETGETGETQESGENAAPRPPRSEDRADPRN